MRQNYNRDIKLQQLLRNDHIQLQKNRLIHVRRPDLADLVAANVGVLHLRYGVHEFLYKNRDIVAAVLRGGYALPGDCATRGEDCNIGEAGVVGGIEILTLPELELS